MTIYANTGQDFQIVDFSATHDQLLLRSMNNRDMKNNIDVIFKGVSHLLIPSMVNGLEVSLLDNSERISFLRQEYHFNTDYGFHIFLVKDKNGSEYFINAMCFGIYHNELPMLESSIGRYDMGDLGELQQWYSGETS